jgi:UMF1 family MFS transporter
VISSNIFISTSFLYLASQEAGCLDDEGVTTDCDIKIYGFRPSSLLTNIAVISSLLSAIFNPVVGAVVDYTDYRHAMGAYTSISIIIIQAVQVYTVSSTWFIMAILQAIAGFLYQIVVCATYAYLPELSSEVGEKKMMNLSPKFTMLQFGTQAAFLISIVVISLAVDSSEVLTAQISQGFCVVVLIVCWGVGWFKFLPNVNAKRKLPAGTSLGKAGFMQLFQTAKHINHNYKKSIRMYLLSLCFAEAGANSFTVVSTNLKSVCLIISDETHNSLKQCAVTFLNEVIKMNGAEIGILFLIVLICAIPGSKLSETICKRTNFNTAWRLNMVYFIIVTVVGVFVLKDENSKMLTYVMGCLWGVALGWFYPMENGFFAVLVPQEQATEMAGIFQFCALIISWVPPFIFTAMNEASISLNFALLHLVVYFAIAIILLSLMPSWDDTLRESHGLHQKVEAAISKDEEVAAPLVESNVKVDADRAES